MEFQVGGDFKLQHTSENVESSRSQVEKCAAEVMKVKIASAVIPLSDCLGDYSPHQ